MEITGKLFAWKPAEEGSLFLVTVSSGFLHLQRRTFVATMDMVSRIIIFDLDSNGIDLIFTLDGVEIVDVRFSAN